MSRRLQVRIDDDELAEIQQIAKRRRTTAAAWVRDTLRAALAADMYSKPEQKLRAIREAMTYSYPIGKVADVLRDIEHGYADPHD